MLDLFEKSEQQIAEAAVNTLHWIAAKNSVSQLMGVCGVVQSNDIKFRIEEPSKRSAESDSCRIKVKIVSEEVTLFGDVHSLSEVSDAGFAAWMAPGALTIVNNIKIVT